MKNTLYPIFLKTDQLKILIVGGGYVALEKLTFLFKSSPNSNVSLVAIEYIPEVLDYVKEYHLTHHRKAYESTDLKAVDIVIGATNDPQTNIQIHQDAKLKNILVNIADNPPYCDFYMGGIVTKGNVKIAISTNGKSPTLAKRLRQFFEEVIPESINELAVNLNTYRRSLKGDFNSKVNQLNDLTQSFINYQNQEK